MRKKKLSALLLLGLGLTVGLDAQMYVEEINSTQTVYALSNIRRISFLSGNAIIQKTDNSTGVYSLSGLRYLKFSDLTTGIQERIIGFSYANLIIYPNPVSDQLTIDLTGVTDEGMISIITLDGKIMQTQSTNGNSLATLSLIRLPKGIYFCRYSSTTETKLVKIIKQ